MASVGHFSTQMPQPCNSSGIDAGQVPSISMAPSSQTRTQMPQPMQPTSQTERTSCPGAVETQRTNTSCGSVQHRDHPAGAGGFAKGAARAQRLVDLGQPSVGPW